MKITVFLFPSQRLNLPNKLLQNCTFPAV